MTQQHVSSQSADHAAAAAAAPEGNEMQCIWLCIVSTKITYSTAEAACPNFNKHCRSAATWFNVYHDYRMQHTCQS
jgi:hypothetical protein